MTRARPKALISWSSGKDSAFALHEIRRAGQFDVVGALTTVTENFDLAPLAGNGRLLLVNTVVEDPVYLNGPYVVSPHFKKEPDGSKWDPTPCSASW